MSEETRGSDDAAEEHVAEKQQGFARPDGPGGDQLLVPRHEPGAPLPTHLDGIEQPPPPPYQESTPLYQDAPPPYQDAAPPYQDAAPPYQQQPQPGYGEQPQPQPGYGEQPRPGFAPAAPGAFWPGTRPPQGPPPQYRPPMSGGGPGPVPPNWAPVPPPPSPTSRSGVSLGAFAIIALVIALIAGAVGAGVAVLATDDSSTTNAPVSLKGNNEQQVAKVRDPKSVAGVAQQVLPSVVTVKVDLGNGRGGTGTGFIVQNGYIITNNHVVDGLSGSNGSMKIVFSDGKESTATVKGTSPANDVAVIKPETTHNLPPLELGNSDDLAQGDPVIAVGSPLGLQGSVTTGIISALNRVVPTGGENGTDSHVIVALQTDAAINPGNSGGPLIDATTGKVIGMNTAIASLGTNGEESGSIGLGFALPINRVQSVATSLISGQSVTKTVIGISMDMAYQGEGVKITTTGPAPLTKDGPAEKAGLKPGDVILTADGKSLNAPEDLLLVVISHAPGDKIKVTYKRGGQNQTVDVTLGAGKS